MSSKEEKIKKSSKISGMHASSEWIQGSSMTHLRTRTQLPLNLKNSSNHSGKDALMICWIFWPFLDLRPGTASKICATISWPQIPVSWHIPRPPTPNDNEASNTALVGPVSRNNNCSMKMNRYKQAFLKLGVPKLKTCWFVDLHESQGFA